jgi:hypothetical protein
VVQEKRSRQGNSPAPPQQRKTPLKIIIITVQIESAFAAGYDPALDLATNKMKRVVSTDELDELDSELVGPWTEHLRRKEQDWIDRIVHGTESGHYFVLLGPKVTGRFNIRRTPAIIWLFPYRAPVRLP